MQYEKLKITDTERVHVLNRPRDLKIPFKSAKSDFSTILAFVSSHDQIADLFNLLDAQSSQLKVVFIYPKGTSKMFDSEVNRDDIIGRVKQDSRLVAPRLVSLDDDWSGFIFRFEAN